MAHFYLTLPSNSSFHYYPDNTVTHYTTRLANAISLSGDWEVGLAEIQYQHTWINFNEYEGRISYSRTINLAMGRRSSVQKIISLPRAYYETPAELVQVINDCLADEDKAMSTYAENIGRQESDLSPKISFRYNDITKRITANVWKGTRIHFSSSLCTMLGIDPHVQNPIVNDDAMPFEWKSLYICDINRGFTALYVYCNILEHIAIGDMKAPLLRIIHASGKSDEIVNVIYEKPQYVPVQQRNFDSIEIDIKADTGQPIPFVHGKVIVTLHFKLCKTPYLLQ